MHAHAFLCLPAHAAITDFDTIPTLELNAFRLALREVLMESTHHRLLACFALPDHGSHRIIAVVGNAKSQTLLLASSVVYGEYESFTPVLPMCHWFEREIAEQYAITPLHHPWLKPIRFHHADATNSDVWNRPLTNPITPADTAYFTIQGPAEHEVAVGPVHAGVIEPGHFRFQCLGEDVHHLEISLGYQHRGIEKALEGGPSLRTSHIAETAAGDSSIAGAWNYASLIESLGNLTPSADTLRLRAILLEFERLANHIGDLGALAGDVAFLPTQSYCGRIRGEYLNMTAEITGNRFGRNMILPGGMAHALLPQQVTKILAWMRKTYQDLQQALQLLFDEPSVLDRFENTGAVSSHVAQEIGLVGTAARAAGLGVDARVDFPRANTPHPDPTNPKGRIGDVFHRAKIRLDEINTSHAWLFAMLESIESTGLIDVTPASTAPSLKPNAFALAITEAWRGELVHIAITDSNGHFRRYKIIDPSFHNWFGLALALRHEQISNFPICNKSFNLSYCGHDL